MKTPSSSLLLTLLAAGLNCDDVSTETMEIHSGTHPVLSYGSHLITSVLPLRVPLVSIHNLKKMSRLTTSPSNPLLSLH